MRASGACLDVKLWSAWRLAPGMGGAQGTSPYFALSLHSAECSENDMGAFVACPDVNLCLTWRLVPDMGSRPPISAYDNKTFTPHKLYVRFEFNLV